MFSCKRIVCSVVLLGVLTACAGYPVGNANVPQPAKSVDLSRYLGRWYEWARYENRFERGCEGVTAEYSRRADGRIDVVNTCYKGSPQGKMRRATGIAKIVPDSGDAKLKVSFFGPFYGDYWVLDRDDDYQWSIVGEPSGKYLWILTRQSHIDDKLARMLQSRVAAMGYDMALLRKTRHR